MKQKKLYQSTISNENTLHRTMKKQKKHMQTNRLQSLPYLVIVHLATFLTGFDALALAETLTNNEISTERRFWRLLGHTRHEKFFFPCPVPKEAFYTISLDNYNQILSTRYYSRFIYNGFTATNLYKLMNCCNTDSFQTHVRLISYSSPYSTFDLPVLSFFNYRAMYKYRLLNPIEIKLFRICRESFLTETPIIVQNLQDFTNNLNKKFHFYLIKNWINFSLFIMAGGSVLNCLLVEGFDSSTQDLDFFWLGGCWSLFLKQIHRFERQAKKFIISEKKNYRVFEYRLQVKTNQQIRIQFIFGRENSNISFILYNFDLDVVQVAFDGSQIISTIGFFQAIATRTFISYKLTNDIFDTVYYLDRSLKYNKRGFKWLCPIDYNDTLAQMPIIAPKPRYDYGFNDFYFNVDLFNMQSKFLHLNLF